MATDNLDVLRIQVRAWLDSNIPPDLKLPPRGTDMSEDLIDWTLFFRRKLGGQGWLAPDWPTHFGGGGYSSEAAQLVREELRRRPLPPLPLDNMWLTPMRAFGTEDQKARWLSRTLRGEITVTHAISEPRGGSDLAGQQTIATKDGDGYLVTGEKGYIHGPFVPDFLFLLVNTDPDGPKYENLSTVIMDVDTDGVTFKKGSRTIMGTADSNVIMDKVWVPADRIVGGEGNGWAVAQCMIDVERGGPGVTADQREEIERRERVLWGS